MKISKHEQIEQLHQQTEYLNAYNYYSVFKTTKIFFINNIALDAT